MLPLESELKLHPGNKSAATLLGITMFRLDHYAKAAMLLTAAVDGEATDINTRYILGSTLLKVGLADAAERVIAQLKTMANDSPQLHLLLAEKYETSGDRVKALAELGQFASLNSNAPLTHHNAGMIYLKLQKRDEAVREFESELQLNPADVQAKYVLANALVTGKDVERGIALLQEVIGARPDHVEALSALARAFLARNEISSAIDSLEHASKVAPENAEVHYELGQAYIAAGRRAEGKNQMDLSRRLRSQSTNSH